MSPDDTTTGLLRQRSMLMILVGACSTAETAFQAADNVVDRQLLADLSNMIERSRGEIEKLTERIEQGSTQDG
jgi:hypothetical protein